MKVFKTIFYSSMIFLFLLMNSYSLNEIQSERAKNLFKETRCLVCEGQNIYESNSESAEDLKKLISEMIIKGKTDKNIKSFLISRYGEWIIMTPPINQTTYFLWFSPIFILLVGFLFIFRKFLR